LFRACSWPLRSRAAGVAEHRNQEAHMQGRRLVILGTVAAGLLLARPAAADPDWGTFFIVGAAALVGPAHVGVDLSPRSDDTPHAILGWSYQIPISTKPFVDGASPHRAVFGWDLLFHDGVGGRGRVGYRYGTRWLFAGVGGAVSGAGPTLSPEAGFKFGHFSRHGSPSLHVLVRGEIQPDFQRVQAITMALGWSLL
jgi:hypothetical protein